MSTPEELVYQCPRSLPLIEGVLSAAKEAAHACHTPTARRHFEYAVALLNESWIAEGGQKANSAEEVIEHVRNGLQLIELLFNNASASQNPH